MTDSTFRFVGRHLDDLADGHVLEPGQFVTLSDEQACDPHNARLIDDRLLVAVPAPAHATPSAVEFARELGVNLADVTATGRGGQITKADVEAHHATKEQS